LCAFGASAAANQHPDPERDVARHVRQEDEQAPPELGLREKVGFVADLDPRQVDHTYEAQPEDVRDRVEEQEEQHADLRREDTRRVTIRAKLYAAIVMTVLGPVITIGVAFAAFQSLSDRFDEVSDRSDRQALALEIKYAVTDVNGWQTAYGYDNGASRPRFERSVRQFRIDLGAARNELTDSRETRLLNEIRSRFDEFMGLDVRAFTALRRGDAARVKRIFLGPELRLFDQMASRADELARHEARSATVTEKEFADSREDSRRGLIAVALGAALVIILLLVTASDIARMALESQRVRR
jgi:hypothetical protein